MTHFLHHRGKDATQIFQNPSSDFPFFLGHNRLKIIDLSDSANQPFFSRDGRYILLYNGEIYNFKALKKTLSTVHTFATQSDTEVLLDWLIHHPNIANIQENLQGMYAFVWIDTIEKKIWLVRDPSGIKPLYWFEDAQYLIISSEIKGILASNLVEKKLNETQIAHYLQFKFAQKPETFFEGIKEVPTDHAICFQWNSTAQNLHHQLLPFQKSSLILDTKVKIDSSLLQKISSLLQNAVQKQWQSDVPLGIWLSGGVDSTLLLALSKDLGKISIPTFTLISAQKTASFDTEDARFARLAAQMYQATHLEIPIEETILGELDDFIEKIDQPIADIAYWLTYLLAKETSKHVKVVLSGAGADEIFGGYNRHQAYRFYLKYKKWIRWALPILKKTSGIWQDGWAHPLRKKFRLIKKMIHNWEQSSFTTFLNFTQMDTSFLPSQNIKNIQDPSPIFTLQEALHYDQTNFLPQDILRLTDWASMQFGVEARVPYLDEHLNHWIKSIPSHHLLLRGKKWLLKEILKQKGGRKFIRRPKEGFGLPIGQWLKKGKYQIYYQELLQKNNLIFEYIDFQKTQYFIHQHLNHQRDFTAEMWALVLLQRWLATHFG